MKRIIWHWTGGAGKANAIDRKRYAFVIEAGGAVVAGVHPPDVNLRIENPRDIATYFAHTARANTAAIGISLAGMRRAVERPFDPGPDPITAAQIDALVRLTADLCSKYKIPVGRSTVLSHAEVERTLGIRQSGKWDIAWLPGMARPGDAIEIGDALRARVSDALRPTTQPKTAWMRRLAGRLPGLLR